ncbi:centromere/kinetochore protein zw10-like [Teleopsis dalmanni]|uniref:centromere/kinetochore protein zw10-like n=1 Tax=Teleopsis dalmanni TaxID=139649 RepID=UPI0018CE1E48|nr:centromere/kinetochore protein zw10-like [Teleopsis dalmanni]XP_037936683.1 centromere/kinetochore protein zw10-like [Teleopsis dalmanni]
MYQEKNKMNDMKSELVSCDNVEATKAKIANVLSQIKRYQEKTRKFIEDNYVEFMPNNSSSDMYLDDGKVLIEESDQILQDVSKNAVTALEDTNAELQSCANDLNEISLGLRLSYRILKIDDLFQCVEESNATKDYLIVLDLLQKIKDLTYSESNDDCDRLFQKCACYDTIKVKYHIQAHMLKQNLQQQFQQFLQLNEKLFPQAKRVTIKISKDVNQMQDIVMALFQAQYNPTKICDFLLENCFEPLITKPVSIEYCDDSNEYSQLTLSYSLKNLGTSLRPSYKQVFEHFKLVLQCLGIINVSISSDQHVFSIIGDHIKERMLKRLVEDCLMHEIPDTMDELRDSTIVEDVHQFEQLLADFFLINIENDRILSNFTENFETYFRNRFSNKLLSSARDIMQKDMHDMTLIAEENSAECVANNPFLFPCCMVSKSTLELIKLMERILRQPKLPETDVNYFLNIICIILNTYVNLVPEVHEKLLESIPQQSVLFYNNCMFLSHWVAKNSEKNLPYFPAIIDTLQSTGKKYFNMQITYQRKIVMDILKEFDLSNMHNLGVLPLKFIRQCMRQLELLKNVWQNVLPDSIYNKTFYDLLDGVSSEIIRRILAMEDISATVANELSELLGVVLDRGPTLFKDKHEVIRIKSWMKLEQLKVILNASLQEITEQWCEGVGILTAHFKADEIRHLIRALFQNTDRRANVLTKIV